MRAHVPRTVGKLASGGGSAPRDRPRHATWPSATPAIGDARHRRCRDAFHPHRYLSRMGGLKGEGLAYEQFAGAERVSLKVYLGARRRTRADLKGSRDASLPRPFLRSSPPPGSAAGVRRRHAPRSRLKIDPALGRGRRTCRGCCRSTSLHGPTLHGPTLHGSTLYARRHFRDQHYMGQHYMGPTLQGAAHRRVHRQLQAKKIDSALGCSFVSTCV